METLHKLAGVQDASDLQASSNEQVILGPPPVPDKDTEAQNFGQHLSQRASRASVPLNRQASHRSFRSEKHGTSRSASRDNLGSSAVDLTDYPPTPRLDQSHSAQHGHERRSHESAAQGSVATSGSTDDFEWGSNHPCFPHPNPHCLPDSDEYKTTRVIRVKRDWLVAGDLYPQYANLYPEILDPLVTDEDFRFLVSNLNARLKAAFSPFTTRAWVDSLAGVVTGYLWDDFGLTGAKWAEKGIERFIEHWNQEKEKEGKGVKVVQLRRTGFMTLDLVVPDPGIDGVGEETAGSEGKSSNCAAVNE